MSHISTSAISSLRSRTGVSILECKKALEDAAGDEEKAIELLRKRGIALAAKKAARDQSEGLIFGKEKSGTAALVYVKCETDFVARDDNFLALGEALVSTLLADGEAAAKKLAETKVPEAVQKLGENISLGALHRIESSVLGRYVHTNGKIGVIVALEGGTAEIAKDVAMHAAAMNPRYVTPQHVPAGDIVKEKEIWKEQLSKEGKPEAILEKIMIGKEKKFREENALTTQAFVKDPGKTVTQYLNGATISRYVRIAVE